jgi:Ca2+-binding RTX toxin-like protein
VNVDYVNHAPVAENALVSFPDNAAFTSGKLGFSDPDNIAQEGREGQTLTVTEVVINGIAYAVTGDDWTRIEGEFGIFNVMPDGSYLYQPYPNTEIAGINDYEAISYKVVDEGGLSAAGSLNIALGTPDLIVGTAGNDSLTGSDGNDIIYGGTGADTIYGGDGNDIIYGEAGSDTIYGGDGNDTIHVGIDGGVVSGGAGDDLLIVEPGHAATEFLWTGEDLDGGSYSDTIRGFDVANDTINLSDIIGSQDTPIDTLLAGGEWNSETHTLTVNGANGSLTAAAEYDNKLVLTLNTTGGGAEQTQTITIEASSQDAFAGFAIDDGGEAAKLLLQEMIKNG